MIAEGRRLPEEVAKNISSLEELSRNELECGQAFKQLLYKDSKVKLNLLYIGPNSKLKAKKANSSKMYYNIDEQEAEMCLEGQVHCMENTSKENWLFVFELKV